MLPKPSQGGASIQDIKDSNCWDILKPMGNKGATLHSEEVCPDVVVQVVCEETQNDHVRVISECFVFYKYEGFRCAEARNSCVYNFRCATVPVEIAFNDGGISHVLTALKALRVRIANTNYSQASSGLCVRIFSCRSEASGIDDEVP